MRVLVCGGREYLDRSKLYETLDHLHSERHFTLVIAGGARGADTLAYEWSTSRGVAAAVYVADWKGQGRKAGPLRNQRMLDEGLPDLAIAFPGGRGTADMVSRARKAGIEVIEIVAR
jgi:hypothetical protein